jgi:6-phosphogluconolactonase (cycloisomerase 2 family)
LTNLFYITVARGTPIPGASATARVSKLLTRDLAATTIDGRRSHGRRYYSFGPEQSAEQRPEGALTMSPTRGTCLAGLTFVAVLIGCERAQPVVGLPPDAADIAKTGARPANPNTSTVAKPADPDTSSKASDLVLVETITRDDLSKVVSSVISPDGKFLYASCWNPGALVVFARDNETGKLTHVQTVAGSPDLRGATNVALSPDARFAALATFASKDAFLFERDPQSGKVKLLHAAPRSGKDWEFPVSVKFSPNGKFACFADDGGRPGPGGIRVFRIEGERLVDVGEDVGRAGCFYGARSLAFHPDGKTLFVACSRPGSLVVVDFNSETGATGVRQILWAKSRGGHDFSAPEVGDVTGTEGLVDVVVSPDGKYLVTSSGRFGGTTAVTSFRFGDDGRLSFVTSVKSSGQKAGGRGFVGGNQVAITPDGRAVYAAGTISGVVASAMRNPSNGALSPGVVVPDGGPPGQPGVKGAAGVTISADGKFVYVATEDKKTLSVFRRHSP